MGCSSLCSARPCTPLPAPRAHRLVLPVERAQQALALLQLAVLATVLVARAAQRRVRGFHGRQRGARVLQLLGQHLQVCVWWGGGGSSKSGGGCC